MANWLDVTRYFGRPKDIPYAGKYTIEFDPQTGAVRGKKYRSNTRFGNVWDAFDPGNTKFFGEKFAKAFGLPTNTPSGDVLFSNNMNFNTMSGAIQKNFGMGLNKFINMGQSKREKLFSDKKQGIYSDVFDPITGMPNRPPRTQEEALMWQWQADQYARKTSERNQANALGALQYSLGMTEKSSPYGLSTMMSPILGQMSNQYSQFQPVVGDYSAFFRPDVLAQSPGNQPGGMPQIPGTGSPGAGSGRIAPAYTQLGDRTAPPRPEQPSYANIMDKKFYPAGF